MNKTARSLIYWIILSPLVILILFPFLVMIITAIKPPGEAIRPTWWPTTPRWDNFATMWEATHFGRALLNSLYTATTSTVFVLAVAIPAAYALSRYSFSGRRGVRRALLATQLMAPIVLVLGLFRLAASLHLVDDLSSLAFIYGALNVAFGVWMLKSSFDSIPIELEEAAWMEGASRPRALWSVFLPLAMPGLIATTMFTLANVWNEFLIALTMMRREENFTLPIQIFDLVSGRYQVEWEYVMAAAMLASLPPAIMFAYVQQFLGGGPRSTR